MRTAPAPPARVVKSPSHATMITPSPTPHLCVDGAEPRPSQQQQQQQQTTSPSSLSPPSHHSPSTPSVQLHVITERLLALCFARHLSSAEYAAAVDRAARMLRSKHHKQYMVFNLSGRSEPLSSVGWQTSECGWPEGIAPALDRLCSLCKSIDTWLSSGPHHVAVLHSRSCHTDLGGWERISLLVSSYIHYCHICRSEERTPERVAMKTFFDDKVRRLEKPSHKRYVNYFTGLLSGMIAINAAPLFLHHVTITCCARPLGDDQTTNTWCYVRVYQAMVPVWTSGMCSLSINKSAIEFRPEGALSLRGDILVKCFLVSGSHDRQLMWKLQLHTCAVSQGALSFSSQELDDVCDESWFHCRGAWVQLGFGASPAVLQHQPVSSNQSGTSQAVTQTSDAVQHMQHPAVNRCNSYDSFYAELRQNIDVAAQLDHTHGPLDGSLYAVVHKKQNRIPPSASTPSTLSAIKQPCCSVSPQRQHDVTGDELHTVSMDSGICSNDKEHQRLSGSSSSGHSPSSAIAFSTASSTTGACATAKTSTSATAANCASSSTPGNRRTRSSVPLATESELDALLHGMLQCCSDIPDLKPSQIHAFNIDTIQTPSFDDTPARLPALSVSEGGQHKASQRAKDILDGAANFYHTPEDCRERLPARGRTAPSRFCHVKNRDTMSSTEKTDNSIPYHARTNSKPFSYLGTGDAASIHTARSPSPQLWHHGTDSPDLTAPHAVDAAQQRRRELESPRLVRKLLSGPASPLNKSSRVTWDSRDSPVPSHSNKQTALRGKENFLPSLAADQAPMDESVIYSTPVKRTISNVKSQFSGPSERNSKANNRSNGTVNGILKSPSFELGYNGDTLRSSRSFRTDTLRSNSSYNTDTMRSDRSYDWDGTLRSNGDAPAHQQAPPVPPPRSSSWRPSSDIQRYFGGVAQTNGLSEIDAMNLQVDPRDPNAKTVTTYDQNTNAMTTVSTQSFDMPCSPRPVRKIVETTKRYMMDDEARERSGVSKLEETIREFVIEDLPVDDVTETDGCNTSWLQKQKLKLQERQQARIREERAPGQLRLMGQLKQRHGLNTSSVSEDGYTSDTTLWTATDDTSREPSPAKCSTPLHVHTSAATDTRLMNGARRGTSCVPAVTPSDTTVTTRHTLDRNTRSSLEAGRTSHESLVNGTNLNRHRSESSHDRPNRPHVRTRCTQPSLQSSQQNIRDEIMMARSSTPVHQVDGLLTTVNGISGVRDPPLSRSTTPAFPESPRTPYVNQKRQPKSPNTNRKLVTVTQTTKTYSRSPSLNRDGSMSPVRVATRTSFEGLSGADECDRAARSPSPPIVTAHPLFVKDNSRWWYKPKMSREQAINLLRNKPAGTFIIRDSHSFPGAYGLAVKVDSAPDASVTNTTTTSDSNQLVRHFLIESSRGGVKVKDNGSVGLAGCEPTFGSLSALVYQHSVTALSLPCKLLLPQYDPASDDVVDVGSRMSAATTHRPSAVAGLGAACDVLYLFSCDVEMLSGPQAVHRAVTQLFQIRPAPDTVVVHFKASSTGITITDQQRKHFFRRHYSAATVSHCGVDPDRRCWSVASSGLSSPSQLGLFGVVAKVTSSSGNNQCHVFAEYESDQPCSAIVHFVCKHILSSQLSSS